MIIMLPTRPSGIHNFVPHYMASSADEGISLAEVVPRQLSIQELQHQQQIYLDMLAASIGNSTDINIIPPTPLSDDSNTYSFRHPVHQTQPQPTPHLLASFIQPRESVEAPHSHSLQSITGGSSPHSSIAISRPLSPTSSFDSYHLQHQQQQRPQQFHQPQPQQNYPFELFGETTGHLLTYNPFQQAPHEINTLQLLGPPQSSNQQHQSTSHYFTTDSLFQCRSPSSPVPSVATTASPSDDGSLIATTNISAQASYENVMSMPIYEVEPVSPLTTIPSGSIMSDLQSLTVNIPSAGSQSIMSAQQPQPPKSDFPSHVQTFQKSSLLSAKSSSPSSSSSPRPQKLEIPQSHNLSQYSSTESVADLGDFVRRAHSDVTDLSSKRSPEESNIYPAATTISACSYPEITSDASSAGPAAKRIAGRSSVPSREGKRPCTICKKWFRKLDDHLWTHSPEPRPHKCRAGFTDGKSTCQYVSMGFARVADRNRHELKHYDGRFVCPFGIENCRIGNERFGRLDTFKRHLRTIHGITQTPAAHDGSSDSKAPSPRALAPGQPHRRHRTRKVSTSDEKLECYNCNRRYYGVEPFIGHLNDCTYALMHPGEADESADVGNDDSN
ncbi:hypothetical protein V1515DRAFT_454803 [Lipomyces mesembrius]